MSTCVISSFYVIIITMFCFEIVSYIVLPSLINIDLSYICHYFSLYYKFNQLIDIDYFILFYK